MIVSRNSPDRRPLVAIGDDPALLRDILDYEGQHGDDYNTRYQSRVSRSVLVSNFGFRQNGEIRNRDATVVLDISLGRLETAAVRYGLAEEHAADAERVDALLVSIDGLKQQLPNR